MIDSTSCRKSIYSSGFSPPSKSLSTHAAFVEPFVARRGFSLSQLRRINHKNIVFHISITAASQIRLRNDLKAQTIIIKFPAHRSLTIALDNFNYHYSSLWPFPSPEQLKVKVSRCSVLIHIRIYRSGHPSSVPWSRNGPGAQSE